MGESRLVRRAQDAQRRDEPVPAARHRCDISKFGLSPRKSAPQGGDIDLEIALMDENVRPREADELILADDVAGSPHQSVKKVERTGADMDGDVAVEQ